MYTVEKGRKATIIYNYMTDDVDICDVYMTQYYKTMWCKLRISFQYHEMYQYRGN